MEQVFDSEPAAAASREWVPWGAILFVANISMFAALGGCLAFAREFKDAYDDPEFAGRTPVVIDVNRWFEAIHVPLWTLAVAGLAVDLGIWWALRRRGRFRAAFNWMWAMTAFVMLVAVIVFGSLIRSIMP